MMNGTEFGKKQSQPNFRYYASIHLERLRKTTKTSISIVSRQGRDLNPGLFEYEAGVLTTRYSV
jgi:hypothetical protein